MSVYETVGVTGQGGVVLEHHPGTPRDTTKGLIDYTQKKSQDLVQQAIYETPGLLGFNLKLKE